MTATLDHLDELERSNLACFWAGVHAAARMVRTLDMDEVAGERLTVTIGDGTAAEITQAVTEILLRAQPRPPAEPKPPVLVPPQARPGGRPS